MKFSKFLITIFILAISTISWAKINLNTASISELETLKGIGAKKAAKIVEYREKVGSFKSIEDLVYVSGIGEATLDKIRNEIEVSNSENSNTNKVKTAKDDKKSELAEKNKENKNLPDTKPLKKDNKSLDKEKGKSDNESKK